MNVINKVFQVNQEMVHASDVRIIQLLDLIKYLALHLSVRIGNLSNQMVNVMIVATMRSLPMIRKVVN